MGQIPDNNQILLIIVRQYREFILASFVHIHVETNLSVTYKV